MLDAVTESCLIEAKVRVLPNPQVPEVKALDRKLLELAEDRDAKGLETAVKEAESVLAFFRWVKVHLGRTAFKPTVSEDGLCPMQSIKK